MTIARLFGLVAVQDERLQEEEKKGGGGYQNVPEEGRQDHNVKHSLLIIIACKKVIPNNRVLPEGSTELESLVGSPARNKRQIVRLKTTVPKLSIYKAIHGVLAVLHRSCF